jgi:sulfite exporter TauE/SafE
MAYGLFGWSASRLNPVLRVLFFAGGAMMLFPGIEVTLAGMAVSAGTLVANRMTPSVAPAAVSKGPE